MVEIDWDEGARAIVLTSAGKVFSVGGDVNTFNTLIQQGEAALVNAVASSMEEWGNPIMRFIAESPVPVVSAVNGPCAGGSLGFALAAERQIQRRLVRSDFFREAVTRFARGGK